MKLWNDSTGLWDLLNLWICENLGALSPSNPRALKPLAFIGTLVIVLY